MSRDPRYQRLLNDKRWIEVKRLVWQRAGGLCERCKRDGIAERGVPYITPGVDCHHKIPVESANPDDPKAMERLAYDVSNIELLCVSCHIKTHQEMHSHKKEQVAENKARARRRFLEANDPNYGRDKERPQRKDVDSHEDGQRGLPSLNQHDKG